MGFVVDKVALGQVFSKYFDFPCQSSSHQLLHSHPHLSSGAGTIGQKWPQCKGLSPTPLAITKLIFINTEKTVTVKRYTIFATALVIAHNYPLLS
jgi:hypothetical protein